MKIEFLPGRQPPEAEMSDTRITAITKMVVSGSVKTMTLTEPAHNIMITSPDGRKAVIDYGGPTLTISGDLPLDDAARCFFEHLYGFIVTDRRKKEDIIAALEEALREARDYVDNLRLLEEIDRALGVSRND
jgi:hypothetical protein